MSNKTEKTEKTLLAHSAILPPQQAGELLHLPRERANWEWMSFFVRRLQPGDVLQTRTVDEEAAFVILGGTCIADWGHGPTPLGKRKNVFDGLPYTLYLPPQNHVSFTAQTACEIAECRVPSTARLQPKLITPQDVQTSLRGGGNASRQIVDVITPAFPAEVDLDEIYYYRIEREGFALQHLYSGDPACEQVVKTRDGDVVLVHSGYHAVVAGPGYDVYYLNFLAGSSRALSVTEDPQRSWIRSTWDTPDPRLPLVRE